MKAKLYKDKFMSCVICDSNPENMNKNARLCITYSSESGQKALTVKNLWMFLGSILSISCMLDDKTGNLVKHNDLLMLYGYMLHEMGGEQIFSKILDVSWFLIKFRKTNDISITTPS